MAIKSVSIRIEEEMLQKLGFVADYEGRSVNSHILVLIRENIRAFEQAHGEIGDDYSGRTQRKVSCVLYGSLPGASGQWRTGLSLSRCQNPGYFLKVRKLQKRVESVAGVGGRSLLPAGGDGRKGIYRGKPHPPQTDRAFKTLRWTYWEKRKNWEFITCDGDNFVSASVMEHNGLVLQDKITNTIDGCAITAGRYTKSL